MVSLERLFSLFATLNFLFLFPSFNSTSSDRQVPLLGSHSLYLGIADLWISIAATGSSCSMKVDASFEHLKSRKSVEWDFLFPVTVPERISVRAHDYQSTT